MRMMTVCAALLISACTPTSPTARSTESVAGLGDEMLGPGHFKIYVSNNGFADQQTVEEIFNRRARELCGGSFAPLDIRYGGRETPRNHEAGVKQGFLPLNAEVVCVKA